MLSLTSFTLVGADTARVALPELLLVIADAIEIVIVLCKWHAEVARAIGCGVDEFPARLVVLTLVLSWCYYPHPKTRIEVDSMLTGISPAKSISLCWREASLAETETAAANARMVAALKCMLDEKAEDAVCIQ